MRPVKVGKSNSYFPLRLDLQRIKSWKSLNFQVSKQWQLWHFSFCHWSGIVRQSELGPGNRIILSLLSLTIVTSEHMLSYWAFIARESSPLTDPILEILLIFSVLIVEMNRLWDAAFCLSSVICNRKQKTKPQSVCNQICFSIPSWSNCLDITEFGGSTELMCSSTWDWSLHTKHSSAFNLMPSLIHGVRFAQIWFHKLASSQFRSRLWMLKFCRLGKACRIASQLRVL